MFQVSVPFPFPAASVAETQSPRKLLHQVILGEELAIRAGGTDFPLLVAEGACQQALRACLKNQEELLNRR